MSLRLSCSLLNFTGGVLSSFRPKSISQPPTFAARPKWFGCCLSDLRCFAYERKSDIVRGSVHQPH
jgi:hypothetical protein